MWRVEPGFGPPAVDLVTALQPDAAGEAIGPKAVPDARGRLVYLHDEVLGEAAVDRRRLVRAVAATVVAETAGGRHTEAHRLRLRNERREGTGEHSFPVQARCFWRNLPGMRKVR